MAIFFPTLDAIKKLKVPPTQGELYLLHFLEKELTDNSYEVYFQPMLNSDRPDIIIMKEKAAVMIIEVKDYQPEYYYIKENDKWHLKKNDIPILSPIEQVKKYKNNIFELHVPELYRNKLINRVNNYGIITCMVYFHNFKETNIEKVRETMIKQDINYINLLSKDTLEDSFYTLIKKANFERTSKYFTTNIYNSLKDMLTPSYHELEIGKAFEYIGPQKQLSISSTTKNLKIQGFSGTGKTAVLAKRAVNALIRTQGPVLILTYNITLKNYIKDQISNIRANFSWDSFEINHYHQFITTNVLNYNIEFDYNYENEELFENVKNEIKKYPVILIDEQQDYNNSWLKIIKKYFLMKNGEFVLFRDINQSIYNTNNTISESNQLEGWSTLTQQFRSPNELANLLLSFQSTYLKHQMKLDSFQTVLDIDKSSFSYHSLNTIEDLAKIEFIDSIFSYFKSKGFPSQNDVAFLGTNKDVLKEFQHYLIRYGKKSEQFITTFASKYEVEVIKNDSDTFKEDLKKFERSKKIGFHMNSGKIKMSTIHSYKGWEIKNLVLIISQPEKHQLNTFNELVYTGISRCRTNLVIITIDNPNYDSFFNRQDALINQKNYRSLDTFEMRDAFYAENGLPTPQYAEESGITHEEYKERETFLNEEANYDYSNAAKAYENMLIYSNLADTFETRNYFYTERNLPTPYRDGDFGITNEERNEQQRYHNETIQLEYEAIDRKYDDFLKQIWQNK